MKNDKEQNPVEKPIKIHLSEVPVEGKDFAWTESDPEMKAYLKDLVGEHPFKVSFHILPIGGGYQLNGQVKTEMDLMCSRCAVDFAYSVDKGLNEILYIHSEKEQRGNREARVNHSTDVVENTVFSHDLKSDIFDVGEFLHEVIALEEPVQPMAKGICDDSCENYQAMLKKGYLTPPEQENEDFSKSSNPFSVLKNIKKH